MITYNYNETSKEITVEEFLNKFRFATEPKTKHLKEVTKQDDGTLYLEYNKDGSYWSKTYTRNEVSGVYVAVNFQ